MVKGHGQTWNLQVKGVHIIKQDGHMTTQFMLTSRYWSIEFVAVPQALVTIFTVAERYT